MWRRPADKRPFDHQIRQRADKIDTATELITLEEHVGEFLFFFHPNLQRLLELGEMHVKLIEDLFIPFNLIQLSSRTSATE